MQVEEPWLDTLARSLGEEPLDGSETNRILGVARDVAHRVERKITPLSTFLLGAAVGRRLAAGGARDAALADGIELVVRALPPPSEDAGAGEPG